MTQIKTLSFLFCFSSICLCYCNAAIACDRWLEARNPEAIVLLSHGMNLKPDVLLPLAGALVEKNFSVFLPAFQGHCPSRGDYLKAKSSEWLEDAERFYREAEWKAKERNLPLFLIAYSFSALVFQVSEKLPFDRKVFLAPALATKFWYPWLITFARYFPDFQFRSRNLPQYAANEKSSLRGILALDDLLQKYESGIGKQDQTPTMIIMDPEDELVKADDVRKIALENHSRKFFPVTNKGHSLEKTYHHLIVSPESLSHAEWKRMITAITEFLLI